MERHRPAWVRKGWRRPPRRSRRPPVLERQRARRPQAGRRQAWRLQTARPPRRQTVWRHLQLAARKARHPPERHRSHQRQAWAPQTAKALRPAPWRQMVLPPRRIVLRRPALQRLVPALALLQTLQVRLRRAMLQVDQRRARLRVRERQRRVREPGLRQMLAQRRTPAGRTCALLRGRSDSLLCVHGLRECAVVPSPCLL